MSKIIKICIVLVIMSLVNPLNRIHAASVKINDLIENTGIYDGKEISITAEAIGEKMNRTEGTWVNVHDGSNAIGIWMPREEAERITTYGSYEETGDMLELSGIFYRACKEHGGEADIHLISMEVLSKGAAIDRNISKAKVLSSVVLSAAAFLVFVVFLNQSKAINEKPDSRVIR